MTSFTTPDTADTARFDPPGPGFWERDISHSTSAPTRLYRRLTASVMPDAYRELFATWGGPIETLDVRWVHGAMYRRVVPLGGDDGDRPPPPRPLMWMLLRLHPEFRRRERAARRMWADRPDHHTIDQWHASERQWWVDRNLAIQGTDPAGLDDLALADHLDDAEAHLWAGWRRHHLLHGSDIGPIGDLLVECRNWRLPTDEVLSTLRGASPATTRSASTARAIADALREAGVDPSTVSDLAQIRSVPEAAAVLDAYLEEVGWQVATSYDLEALTIGEMPAAVCNLVRTHGRHENGAATSPEADTIAHLRQRVPVADRARFDDLVARARSAYGLRDDNGPLTAEWPMGLLRRAVLETGRRLVARGRLHDERHVFELDVPEMAALLRGRAAPSADELSERAAQRGMEAELQPPDTLGPHAPDPELSVFPPNMRRTLDIVITAMSLLEVDPATSSPELDGLGVGDRSHRGRARVVIGDDAIGEVFAEMEPGDVLVAPWTAPTFNPLFSLAGAVVVREGGWLSHAAVMARELSIPAVIGCRGATDIIHDGDLVEVDPVAGRVTVLTDA